MEISLPNTIEYIGRGAFSGCDNLVKIKIAYDKNIKNKELTIGSSAFCGCAKLSEFLAPSSLAKIQTYSFADCPSLKRLKTQIVEAQNLGFKNCTALYSLLFAKNAKVNDLSLTELLSLSAFYFKGDAEIALPILSDMLQRGIKIICRSDSNLSELAYYGYNVSIA